MAPFRSVAAQTVRSYRLHSVNRSRLPICAQVVYTSRVSPATRSPNARRLAPAPAAQTPPPPDPVRPASAPHPSAPAPSHSSLLSPHSFHPPPIRGRPLPVRGESFGELRTGSVEPRTSTPPPRLPQPARFIPAIPAPAGIQALGANPPQSRPSGLGASPTRPQKIRQISRPLARLPLWETFE